MKYIVSIICLIFTIKCFAQATDKDVIIKYKEYESFDLGNLEIKGSVLAPGDLSVRERERKVFAAGLYNRANFNPEIEEDIRNLR
tara:strand:- start:5988 stop:6242 length:255 start_codon:yes stop_codon:yes gene_type:complete